MSDIVSEFYLNAEHYQPCGVIGIAFDVETIGGCLTKNAMPELGAVAMAVEDVDKRRVLARFEGHMNIPKGRGFEPQCEKEFWDVHKPREKAKILACQTSPEAVMRSFVQWVFEVRKRYAGGDSSRVRFVTDAAYFDAAWVSQYLTTYADHYPLHTFFSDNERSRFNTVIDTNAFFRGIARASLNDEIYFKFSSSAAVRTALNIPDTEQPDVDHDHRAVHDAENIMKEYLIVMKYLNIAAAREDID